MFPKVTSKDRKQAEFEKKLELNRHLDNSKFRKAIKKVFKERRSGINKTISKRPVTSSKLIPVPKYSPKDTLGSTIDRADRYSYRPPQEYQLKFGSTSTSSKRQAKYRSLGEPTNKSQKSSNWPPPSDSNFRQSTEAPTSSPSNLVLPVHCDKCGKENLSGPKQLAIHQQSKKCRNRQDRGKTHQCSHCNRLFDTSHNLKRHNCPKL